MEQRRNSKYLKYLRRGLFVLAGLFLCWGFLVEPNCLRVRRETVLMPELPPEWEGVRALVVGDTHFGSSCLDRWRRDRILRYAGREKADLCFLLGDYTAVGSIPGYGAMADDELKKFFSGLKAPLGNFAVLGNHELWFGRKKMTGLLEQSGFQMIEGKIVKLKGSVFLAGIADAYTVPYDRRAVSRTLKGYAPLLLLSHKGEMLKFISAPPSVLMLSADTHGGQIRIPGVSSLKDWLKGKKEMAPGLSERWGKKLFITTGAGGHRIGFRLFCPPEIAVITFTNGKRTQI